MTDWKLGQYVRIWRSGSVGEHDAGGYEYGHIETMDSWNGFVELRDGHLYITSTRNTSDEVMLVGDDGKEIHCRVKDLEEE